MKKIIIAILLGLIFTLQIQAQEPEYKIYLPVIFKMLVAPDTNNNWRIIQPIASSNLVLNPSAEIAANFSAIATATVTRSTTFQKYGLFSYRVQPAASGDGIQLTTSTLTNAHHFVTVRIRGSFTSLSALLNGNSKPLTLIEKIDSNWSLYGASFGASLASGATALQITDTASGDFYVDGIQVEPLTFWTTYIDGTQSGCAWLGVANAAASERSGQSRAGGVSLDFWEEYKFQIHRIVGAGAASHNLSIDSYAILPGGELNSDKVTSRDFDIIGKFIAETEQELHQKRQALEAAFQTDDNQLTLIRFNGAEVQKEIAVRYQSGLEANLAAFYGKFEIVSNEEVNEVRKFTEDTSIQVAAPNPYWLEVGESAVDLDTNDSGTFRIVAGRLRGTGQWDVLGPPDAAGTYTDVRAIVEDDTYVYVGGVFSNFDNIANADSIVRWHKQDQVWSALDVGLTVGVLALAIAPNGDLYIGGQFLNAGGIAAADYITRWDGTNFNAVGVPNTGAAAITNVLTLVFDHGGDLFIGGNFLNWADIANADFIARWDGTSYSALSTGADALILALALGIDNEVFVGGNFLNIGGVAANRIASWNGTAFSALGSGVADLVNVIAVREDGIVFLGGQFQMAGGAQANFIASWNGTAFSPLGDGMNNNVLSLSIGPDEVLYASGQFTIAGGIDLADRAARWNNFTWAHLDLDLPGSPNVFAVLASRFSDPVVEQNYDLFLGSSTTGTGTFAGAITATNEGSVQAFPKIVYARSGGTTAVIETLRNERTGLELLFDYPLLDGETLTIDLDPLEKTIISSFFGSRLDAVLPNSDFGTWSLPREDSNVTSYINESGTPTLEHYMLWRDAYSGYD